jgi:hypothetical protein
MKQIRIQDRRYLNTSLRQQAIILFIDKINFCKRVGEDKITAKLLALTHCDLYAEIDPLNRKMWLDMRLIIAAE